MWKSDLLRGWVAQTTMGGRARPQTACPLAARLPYYRLQNVSQQLTRDPVAQPSGCGFLLVKTLSRLSPRVSPDWEVAYRRHLGGACHAKEPAPRHRSPRLRSLRLRSGRAGQAGQAGPVPQAPSGCAPFDYAQGRITASTSADRRGSHRRIRDSGARTRR